MEQNNSNRSEKIEENRLTLQSQNESLAVFNVTVNEIANASSIYIDVKDNSTVLINVEGSDAIFAGKQIFYGSYNLTKSNEELLKLSRKILWNIPSAETITMSSFALYGSLVAPHADFISGNGDGQLNGTLIVDNYYNAGFGDIPNLSQQPAGKIELHNYPFEGVIDTLPEQPDQSTEEDSEDPTPEVSPAPDPDPTPEVTPTPDPDPTSTPEVTPTPDPDPKPTPEVTPTPDPDQDPDPTPTIDPNDEESPLQDSVDDSNNENLEDKEPTGIEDQTNSGNTSADDGEDKKQNSNQPTASLPTIDLENGQTPLTNVEMTSNPDSDELQSKKTPQPTITVVTEQIPQTGESSNQAIVGIILLVLAAGTALLMYAIKKSKPAKD